MPSDPERYRLIEGGAKPKAYRAKRKGDPEPLVCPCGSSTTVDAKVGRMIDGNRIKGGTRIVKCYHCGRTLA